MDQAIEKTKDFLRQAFIKNPKFSFNNWEIMYNHSLKVLEFSLKISNNIPCDNLVLSIGALLHDIGKAHPKKEEILIKRHGELGWQVCKDFLKSLNLNKEQIKKLKDIFDSKGKAIEKDIILDADTIAFFADKNLQESFKKWAKEKNLEEKMERKLKKFYELRFEISKKIAEPLFLEMKKTWTN